MYDLVAGRSPKAGLYGRRHARFCEVGEDGAHCGTGRAVCGAIISGESSEKRRGPAVYSRLGGVGRRDARDAELEPGGENAGLVAGAVSRIDGRYPRGRAAGISAPYPDEFPGRGGPGRRGRNYSEAHRSDIGSAIGSGVIRNVNTAR